MALLELGYEVNNDFRLKGIKTGKGFRFRDQDHYDEVGHLITQHVQELMVEEYGMRRIELPLKQDVHPWKKIEGAKKCPVFLSNNAFKAKELLILICGSGHNVQAGLWSRKLCINESVQRGSVLPFLEWAHARGIAVLVLNPNYPEVVTMHESENSNKLASGTAHVVYAWDAICKKLPAEHIAIVVHSAGGHDTCELLKYREKEVLKSLRCVAFGDTIQLCINRLSDASRMFLVENAIDWVVSKKPLDMVVKKASPSKQKVEQGNRLGVASNCIEVSAGTTRHVDVIMSAFASICDFLLVKLSPQIKKCAI